MNGLIKLIISLFIILSPAKNECTFLFYQTESKQGSRQTSHSQNTVTQEILSLRNIYLLSYSSNLNVDTELISCLGQSFRACGLYVYTTYLTSLFPILSVIKISCTWLEKQSHVKPYTESLIVNQQQYRPSFVFPRLQPLLFLPIFSPAHVKYFI